MINFSGVTKQYFSDTALEQVTFTIEKGDFVFLVGPTGSGKTTIFRLIIRDLLPTEGDITIGSIDVVKLPQKKIRELRRNVGVVFQDLKLLLDRTVGENVMLPLQLSGIDENEARRKSEEVLMNVGLSQMQNKFPLQLSGGERQRVAIARALVFDPEVILADEPTGNLDMQTSLQILDLLESINKRGTTIFMATHNDRIIDTTKRRVLVMEQGKLKEDRRKKTDEKKHETSEQPHTSSHEPPHHKSEKKEVKETHSAPITLEALAKKGEEKNDAS